MHTQPLVSKDERRFQQRSGGRAAGTDNRDVLRSSFRETRLARLHVNVTVNSSIITTIALRALAR